MALRARIVLADCDLLRAVGNVLDKVDQPGADRQIQVRIDEVWQRLKISTRPNIFHDFIEAERNDTLKQYEIGAAPNPKIHGAWTTEGAPLYVSHVPGRATLAALSMTDGPYKGLDPRQLARDAIEFWRNYLEAIEPQVKGWSPEPKAQSPEPSVILSPWNDEPFSPRPVWVR